MRSKIFIMAGACGIAFAPVAAHAHAQLQKAVPGVGATISAAPPAISLSFSEPVEPRFCGVSLSDGSGRSIALGKPVTAAGGATLAVSVQGKLSPGLYTVTWHAVSVDTHRTQGRFSFTLAP